MSQKVLPFEKESNSRLLFYYLKIFRFKIFIHRLRSSRLNHSNPIKKLSFHFQVVVYISICKKPVFNQDFCKGHENHKVIEQLPSWWNIRYSINFTFLDTFKDASSTHQNFTLLGPKSLHNQRGCVTPTPPGIQCRYQIPGQSWVGDLFLFLTKVWKSQSL